MFSSFIFLLFLCASLNFQLGFQIWNNTDFLFSFNIVSFFLITFILPFPACLDWISTTSNPSSFFFLCLLSVCRFFGPYTTMEPQTSYVLQRLLLTCAGGISATLLTALLALPELIASSQFMDSNKMNAIDASNNKRKSKSRKCQTTKPIDGEENENENNDSDNELGEDQEVLENGEEGKNAPTKDGANGGEDASNDNGDNGSENSGEGGDDDEEDNDDGGSDENNEDNNEDEEDVDEEDAEEDNFEEDDDEETLPPPKKRKK